MRPVPLILIILLAPICRAPVWGASPAGGDLDQASREAKVRRVVGEALKVNGPWFPDEAAKLKAPAKTRA